MSQSTLCPAAPSSQVAADRDIKIGTVREHLKAVFAKTRTQSQADLTGVLTRLALLAP
jgi:DNA-binding CsgD family transcriptional regulator